MSEADRAERKRTRSEFKSNGILKRKIILVFKWWGFLFLVLGRQINGPLFILVL